MDLCGCACVLILFLGIGDRVAALPGIWDLALNKKTSQSTVTSRSSASYAHPSSHANDADKSTYAMATGRRQAWWTVDLGEVSRVDRVLSYLDSRAFDKKYNVETSKDGRYWRSCGNKAIARRAGGPRKMVSQVMRCIGAGKDARYVRISAKAPYWTSQATLALYDVKVYGKGKRKQASTQNTDNIEVKALAPPTKVEAGEGQMNERGALGVPECTGDDLRGCSNYPKSNYYCTQSWMRKNCPFKCGWCRYADPPPRPRVPEPAPPVEVNAAAEAGNLPECKKDNHRSCYTYKDKDYYCKQRWMQKNCAQYCDRCKFRVVKYARPPTIDPADETPVCYGNEHRMCSYFIKYDKKFYCRHVWVRKNCRFMCGICKYN